MDVAPTLAGLIVDTEKIIGFALRSLALGTRSRSSRELPNGAIVFDLGTV